MGEGRLTILQVNDVHGYLEPHPELVWTATGPTYPNLGGYARLSGYFRQVRREAGGAVLALDNGDTFHGTLPVVASRGRALLPILSHLRFDGMTAHWDFAYGPLELKALAAELPYPVLAINCYDCDTGQLSFPPTRVVERGGLRIGIVGVAATIVDKTMPPHFSTGVHLTLGRDELPGHIAQLRQEEGVDLIVVLSHLGFPQDVKLAGEVDGIDILLSGHTHNRMETPALVNGATIIQSGCHGAFVGRLDVQKQGEAPIRIAHRLVPMDASIATDPEMEALVDAALAPHRTHLVTEAGHTEVALDRNHMFESTMDDLLLAAIAAAAGTDLAFSNGWRYGAPIRPGPITVEHLHNVIPSDPPVSVVDITGAELVDMLEENLHRTFAADPYEQMGGYLKRCRGLQLLAKIENPRGQRIQALFVGSEPVQLNKVYQAAFVTQQGVPTRYGRNRANLDIRAIAALRQYLDGASWTGAPAGSVTVV
jgi:2',3'-cyclic-nucleotide 2'-phosphodiesterase (5'-nucleotidase family)